MGIEFIQRKTIPYRIKDLPFDKSDDNVQLPSASAIKLVFAEKTHPLDIGGIAYLERQYIQTSNSRHKDFKMFSVSPQTLNQYREKALINLLESIQIALKMGHMREITIYNKIKVFIKYIDWCDHNGYSSVLDNVHSAEIAYSAYTHKITHQIRTNSLSLYYGSKTQAKVLDCLDSCFNEKFRAGQLFRKIHRKNTFFKPTEPPNDNDVKKVIQFCTCLFEKLSKFALEAKPYPFLLELPEESVWIFPTLTWAVSKKSKYQGLYTGTDRPAWNYREGRVNQVEEVLDIYLRIHDHQTKKQARISLKASINKAKDLLNTSNSDSQHYTRIHMAEIALDAFIVLFVANTGMNPSQLRQLKWDDKFKVSSEIQSFKSIKYRAQGKEVTFNITSTFLRKFKGYIKLRKFLVPENSSTDLLFFKRDCSKKGIKALEVSPLRKFYCKIHNKLDPDLPAITSRQWRAYKAYQLLNKKDPVTTAILLQNDVNTALAHYAESNPLDTEKEFTDFYHALSSKISVTLSKNTTSLPIGHCNNINHPKAETGAKHDHNTPDCKTPEGCLFCKNYLIHADETDIRKLVSLAYVIKETTHLSTSIDFYQETFGTTLKRIDDLLEAISIKSEKLKALVAYIKDDTYRNENLTSYWEHKLNMLCKVGAL